MKSVIKKVALEEKKQVDQKAGKDPVDSLEMVKERVPHDLVLAILIIRSYHKRTESYAFTSKLALINLIVSSSILKDRVQKDGSKAIIKLQKFVD